MSKPAKKVGIIGAGQLGQMLGRAGERLGVDCVFLDPAERAPAAVTGPVLKYDFDDLQGLRKLVDQTDIITYEFENVPVTAVESILPSTTVYPPPQALQHAQDRLAEKSLFQSLDIPVTAYKTVDSEEDMHLACSEIGLPVVLKTRRMGYDGKGQSIIRHEDEIAHTVAELGSSDLIAEQWVNFDREVSAIGVRSVSGEIAFYPLTENQHSNGILNTSRAPTGDNILVSKANEYLRSLLDHLNYVGVIALELFVIDGKLLANEFAPRVHNSGHWTIEGATTSQFENHLRAILDMPLGATNVRGCAGMVNLVGEIPAQAMDLAPPDYYLHDYGKEPRPGRKLGHITIVARAQRERDALIEQLGKLLIN